jgi:hypothetical protein
VKASDRDFYLEKRLYLALTSAGYCVKTHILWGLGSGFVYSKIQTGDWSGWEGISHHYKKSEIVKKNMYWRNITNLRWNDLIVIKLRIGWIGAWERFMK